MESIFILILIFFIISIASIFIFAKMKANDKDRLEQQLVLTELKRMQIANYLPELQCSFNGIIDHECYDMMAVEAFKEKAESPDYLSLLGSMNLIIEEYDGEWVKHVVVNASKEKFDTKTSMNYPITLYYPLTNKKNPGVVHLEIYT